MTMPSSQTGDDPTSPRAGSHATGPSEHTDPGATAAIILAGGRASRLGGADKAAIEVGGRMLIDHVCAAVAGCVPIVAVGPSHLARPGVTAVREAPVFGGPVAAVAAALEALGAVTTRLPGDHAPPESSAEPVHAGGGPRGGGDTYARAGLRSDAASSQGSSADAPSSHEAAPSETSPSEASSEQVSTEEVSVQEPLAQEPFAQAVSAQRAAAQVVRAQKASAGSQVVNTAQNAETWLLACDLLRAGDIIALLADRPIPSGHDGIILADPGGHAQWLAGRYRIAALQCAVETLPEVSGVSMKRLVSGLRLHTVTDDAGAAVDLDTWSAIDHYRNTREDGR